MKVLAICGSLRKNSTNMGMVRYARDNAPQGMTIEVADLHDIPFYNADISEHPAAIKRLFKAMDTADALLLSCPEYNYSIAPALKNALDWASRETDNALLDGKPVAIMGSGGGMGSSRAQYHLRQVCVFLNLHPLNKPEVFAGAFTSAFDDQGNLVDDKIQSNIKNQLAALADWTRQLGQ